MESYIARMTSQEALNDSQLKKRITGELIDHVREKTLIWNLRNTDHSNQDLIAKAFIDILKKLWASQGHEVLERVQLNTAEKLKAKWKNLKDNYLQQKKAKPQQPSGGSAWKPPKWFMELSFLDARKSELVDFASQEDGSSSLVVLQSMNTALDPIDESPSDICKVELEVPVHIANEAAQSENLSLRAAGDMGQACDPLEEPRPLASSSGRPSNGESGFKCVQPGVSRLRIPNVDANNPRMEKARRMSRKRSGDSGVHGEASSATTAHLLVGRQGCTEESLQWSEDEAAARFFLARYSKLDKKRKRRVFRAVLNALDDAEQDMESG